jgi:hypothetical protein
MDRRTSADRAGWGLRISKLAPAAWFLAVLVVLGVAAVRQGLDEEQRMQTRLRGGRVHALRFEPRTASGAIPAGEAQLPDDRPVIGVEIGGRCRAYDVKALTLDRNHVVNDLLAGVPVSVAYCPATDCASVYTDPKGSAPLPVAVGGWVGEDAAGPGAGSVMLLRVGSVTYIQDTGEAVEGGGPFPYPAQPFSRTSWGEWRHAHPGTDVVTDSTPQVGG